jgi:hypothetical protein
MALQLPKTVERAHDVLIVIEDRDFHQVGECMVNYDYLFLLPF